MSKTVKTILILAFASVLALAVVGCSKENPNLGKWTGSLVELGTDAMYTEVEEPEVYNFVLNEDGTGQYIYIEVTDEEMTSPIVWTINENAVSITFTEPDTTIDGTIQDGVMTFSNVALSYPGKPDNVRYLRTFQLTHAPAK